MTETIDERLFTLMDAVRGARDTLASEPHKADLREIARITNEMLALDTSRKEIQARIDARNKAYHEAEDDMDTYLASKKARNGPPAANSTLSGSEGAETLEPAPRRSERAREGTSDHAANCAVFFGDSCDCQ